MRVQEEKKCPFKARLPYLLDSYWLIGCDNSQSHNRPIGCVSFTYCGALNQFILTRCENLHNAIGVAAECMEPPSTDQPHTNLR